MAENFNINEKLKIERTERERYINETTISNKLTDLSLTPNNLPAHKSKKDPFREVSNKPIPLYKIKCLAEAAAGLIARANFGSKIVVKALHLKQLSTVQSYRRQRWLNRISATQNVNFYL